MRDAQITTVAGKVVVSSCTNWVSPTSLQNLQRYQILFIRSIHPRTQRPPTTTSASASFLPSNEIRQRIATQRHKRPHQKRLIDRSTDQAVVFRGIYNSVPLHSLSPPPPRGGCPTNDTSYTCMDYQRIFDDTFNNPSDPSFKAIAYMTFCIHLASLSSPFVHYHVDSSSSLVLLPPSSSMNSL